MQPIEIKPGIYWVGAIDWELRNFHGYITPRGSTYNSYLIVDEHITLIDGVKKAFVPEMLERISQIVDPSKIRYLVADHIEPDHSGGIPELMEIASEAEIVCSAQAKRGLGQYYDADWPFMVVKAGDSLNIGKRTLEFTPIPMVHWPDSMATYIPEEKLLLPNDAFGQHIASTHRFDDQIGWDVIYEEATSYYANIVLPYGGKVKQALAAFADREIDMIAPSHGLIYRKYVNDIVSAYGGWADNETEARALIVYDTMWESTKKLTYALQSGLEDVGVPVTVRSLQTSHVSEIMKDVLLSKAVLLGTPTLNNGYLATVGGFLTYLKGLRPKERIGFAYGSYGWGGQGAKEAGEALANIGFKMPLDIMNIQYAPGEEDIKQAREIGKELGKIILSE